MSIRIPDPNEDQQLDADVVEAITINEALRWANGERIVLARVIRRVLTAYQARTTAQRPVEYRWTDTNGILRNRDGLIICAAHAGDGARCINGADHPGPHLYRERTIR